MSYFASSASPEVAHWHEEKPTQFMTQTLEQNIKKATHEALEAVKEIAVTTEHTMESLCEELGIHPFHHNFFAKLEGTTLALYANGHLEIRREGQKHYTSFPVQLIS